MKSQFEGTKLGEVPIPPEPPIGVHLFLGFRFTIRKISTISGMDKMHEEKTFSRKDGLLVRSARESLANEVRQRLRINRKHLFGFCSYVKVSNLYDYRQTLLKRRRR